MLVNIDTTHIPVDKSSDAYAQQQTFSGDRGKGHCVFFSNMTCSSGSILAVSPGPNIACPPRGGDGVSLGIHLAADQTEREATGVSQGLPKLGQGTDEIGIGLVCDRGYIFRPRVNIGSNQTVLEYCEQNDILPLYRPKRGEMGLSYNTETDLIEQTQNNQDDTNLANSGRVTTFARAASESTHLFKRGYRLFEHRVHNSRLDAIGARKIAFYNRLFDKNYGNEWAEMSKLNVEYLVMAGK